MSGPDLFSRPRSIRRGAALTLVFASVLFTGAAAGSWSEQGRKDPEPTARSTAPADKVTDAAAEAMADGKSPAEAAEDAVSRSGDRWGSVYDEAEYEEFAQELEGEYTGVGLWARRTRDGGIEVTRVQRGGPAERAGIV
ncbi:peptidase S41, partial [Streptomyces sp. T-3]|nr:peptidase S41 [Streptomyces sp. T-3]